MIEGILNTSTVKDATNLEYMPICNLRQKFLQIHRLEYENDTSSKTYIRDTTREIEIEQHRHFLPCINNVENGTASCNMFAVTLIFILLSIMCTVSLTGNLVILLVSFSKQKYQQNSMFIYKASLAVADLLIGFFIIPSILRNIIFFILYPYYRDESATFITADMMDKTYKDRGFAGFYTFVYNVSLSAGIYSIFAMSIDRVIVIKYPNKNRLQFSAERKNRKQTRNFIVCLIWGAAILPSFLVQAFTNSVYSLNPHTFIWSWTLMTKNDNDTEYFFQKNTARKFQ